jgi:hypothetical protein
MADETKRSEVLLVVAIDIIGVIAYGRGVYPELSWKQSLLHGLFVVGLINLALFVTLRLRSRRRAAKQIALNNPDRDEALPARKAIDN